MTIRQILITGTITLSPECASERAAPGCSPVPGSTELATLETTPSPKPSAVAGSGARAVATVFGTFATLSGVGATDSVTTADFLWLRSDGPVLVQLTQQNLASGSGTITSIVQVLGELIVEFPEGGYLVGLAASGTADLEWTVSGPA